MFKYKLNSSQFFLFTSGKLIFLVSIFISLLIPASSPTVAAPHSCPTVENTPYFTLAYGSVLINGEEAPIGTIVEARSPRGDLVGCFTTNQAGLYGAMSIYGEDTSITPTIPGMRAGETVLFQINGNDAVNTPDLVWMDDRNYHEIDLSVNILSPPGAVTMVSPFGNISTSTPTFIWEPEPTATGYTLVVYRVNSNTILFSGTFDAESVCNSSQCSVQLVGLTLAPGDHTWIMQAENDDGPGPWSIYQP